MTDLSPLNNKMLISKTFQFLFQTKENEAKGSFDAIRKDIIRPFASEIAKHKVNIESYTIVPKVT